MKWILCKLIYAQRYSRLAYLHYLIKIKQRFYRGGIIIAAISLIILTLFI
jgi:hypothetical protein